MKVYADMHCGCIYESAFAVVSLHRTKAAAYRAMRNRLIDDCVSFRETWLKWGRSAMTKGWVDGRDTANTVREFEVGEDY